MSTAGFFKKKRPDDGLYQAETSHLKNMCFKVVYDFTE